MTADSAKLVKTQFWTVPPTRKAPPAWVVCTRSGFCRVKPSATASELEIHKHHTLLRLLRNVWLGPIVLRRVMALVMVTGLVRLYAPGAIRTVSPSWATLT